MLFCPTVGRVRYAVRITCVHVQSSCIPYICIYGVYSGTSLLRTSEIRTPLIRTLSTVPPATYIEKCARLPLKYGHLFEFHCINIYTVYIMYYICAKYTCIYTDENVYTECRSTAYCVCVLYMKIGGSPLNSS